MALTQAMIGEETRPRPFVCLCWLEEESDNGNEDDHHQDEKPQQQQTTPSSSQTTPNLDTLPLELLHQIARLLDYRTLLHLSSVSRGLRAVLDPDLLLSRDDKLAAYQHAEKHFPQHADRLVCFNCFRFLPRDAFADSMRTGPKGKNGKDVVRQRGRFCFECGVKGRKYQHMKAVRKGGLRWFPCHHCRAATLEWEVSCVDLLGEEHEKVKTADGGDGDDRENNNAEATAAAADGQANDTGDNTTTTTTTLSPSQLSLLLRPLDTISTSFRGLPTTPLRTRRSPLPRLPESAITVLTTPTLLSRICSFLPYSSILSLRLTCRYLHRTIPAVPLGTPFSQDVRGAGEHVRRATFRERKRRQQWLREDRMRNGWHTVWPRHERYDPGAVRGCYGCFRVRSRRHFSAKQWALPGGVFTGEFWRRRCWECLRRMYHSDRNKVDWEARRRFERQRMCRGCGFLKFDDEDCEGCEESRERAEKRRREREVRRMWGRVGLEERMMLEEDEMGLVRLFWEGGDEDEDEVLVDAMEKMFGDEEEVWEWQKAVAGFLQETALWGPDMHDDEEESLKAVEKLFEGDEWFYEEEEEDDYGKAMQDMFDGDDHVYDWYSAMKEAWVVGPYFWGPDLDEEEEY